MAFLPSFPSLQAPITFPTTGLPATEFGRFLEDLRVLIDALAGADVRAFGVKADGVTDDTAAMLAARDSGACTLRLPAGRIMINGAIGLHGVSNQIWQGCGTGSTFIVMATDDPVQELWHFNNCTNFEVRDLTLDYDNKTPDPSTPALSALSCTDCTDFALRRVNIIHGTILGFTFIGCTRGTVEDCVIARDATVGSYTNQSILFATSASVDMRILRTTHLNWGMNHGYLFDSWIVDNTFDGFWFGAAISGGGDPFLDARNIIRGNIVRNGSDQVDHLALRPVAIEEYSKRSIIDGNIVYNVGGAAIRSAGEYSVVNGNIVFNYGQRNLIAPSEIYAGIELLRSSASDDALKNIVTGNIAFHDNATVQAWGMRIEGGGGVPNEPEYAMVYANQLTGTAGVIESNSGRYKMFGGMDIEGSATYDPASLNTGTRATTTLTVVGAALGDKVTASFSLDMQGIELFAYVSSANTVTVVFKNDTGGTIDLASGTIRVSVSKASDAAVF